MPWQNQGGGNNNPWGNGPKRGGPSGGGEPPQIDEFIKKGQEKLQGMMPGGFGSVFLALLVVVAIWLAFGFYRVQPNEQGVVLQFGKRTELTGPGLHWHLPYPIETVEVRGVTNEETVSIGARAGSNREESLMLTQDENIVDVRFNVVWRIKDLGNYLFQLQDPQGTIKAVAESVMRELVGQNGITPIITTARGTLEEDALVSIQETLDEYKSGITVLRVQIIESEAPEEVKDAFLDVQRAEADQQSSRNRGIRHANEVIPKAQGDSEKILQEAQAYKAETVARAEGEAARFLSVYNEYIQAKEVTKKRMYLEAMEEILSGMDKTILENSTGAIPYLSIDELKKNKARGQ